MDKVCFSRRKSVSSGKGWPTKAERQIRSLSFIRSCPSFPARRGNTRLISHLKVTKHTITIMLLNSGARKPRRRPVQQIWCWSCHQNNKRQDKRSCKPQRVKHRRPRHGTFTPCLHSLHDFIALLWLFRSCFYGTVNALDTLTVHPCL